jgi:hypothetical protein
MTVQDVKFSLWAVLGAIVFLFGSIAAVLWAEQKETKSDQAKVESRLIAQEAHSTYIIKQLDKLTSTVDRIDEKLETHRIKTEATEREKLRKVN